MMHRRRRVHRQSAGWQGACLIDNEVDSQGWRECRVIDISMLGAGISLSHTEAEALVGHSISVEAPWNGGSLSLRLEGTIRHAEAIGNGMIRLGVEFAGLSETEKTLASVLSEVTKGAREAL